MATVLNLSKADQCSIDNSIDLIMLYEAVFYIINWKPSSLRCLQLHSNKGYLCLERLRWLQMPPSWQSPPKVLK